MAQAVSRRPPTAEARVRSPFYRETPKQQVVLAEVGEFRFQ